MQSISSIQGCWYERISFKFIFFNDFIVQWVHSILLLLCHFKYPRLSSVRLYSGDFRIFFSFLFFRFSLSASLWSVYRSVTRYSSCRNKDQGMLLKESAPRQEHCGPQTCVTAPISGLLDSPWIVQMAHVVITAVRCEQSLLGGARWRRMGG